MSNIIPCKMCGEDFNYVQNISGNARPLCDRCRKVADEKEVAEEIENEIKSGNRYILGAPNRKDEYDVTEILLDGKFPEFKSDADRAVCVIELATFINNNGFCGNEGNVAKFLKHIGPAHRVLFLRNLNYNRMEYLIDSSEFKLAFLGSDRATWWA